MSDRPVTWGRVLAAVAVGLLLAAGVARADEEAMVTATGRASARPGLPANQARLMAERGARVVAMRNLARALLGEELDLDRTEQGLESLDVLLRGVEELRSEAVGPEEHEVTVGIRVSRIGAGLRELWRTNRLLAEEAERLRAQRAELQQRMAELEAARQDLRQQLEATRHELVQAREEIAQLQQAAAASTGPRPSQAPPDSPPQKP